MSAKKLPKVIAWGGFCQKSHQQQLKRDHVKTEPRFLLANCISFDKTDNYFIASCMKILHNNELWSVAIVSHKSDIVGTSHVPSTVLLRFHVQYKKCYYLFTLITILSNLDHLSVTPDERSYNANTSSSTCDMVLRISL